MNNFYIYSFCKFYYTEHLQVRHNYNSGTELSSGNVMILLKVPTVALAVVQFELTNFRSLAQILSSQAVLPLWQNSLLA